MDFPSVDLIHKHGSDGRNAALYRHGHAGQSVRLGIDEMKRRTFRLGRQSVHETSPEDVRIYGSRSEEHTSELQSLMRISYAVFCLKKKIRQQHVTTDVRNQ